MPKGTLNGAPSFVAMDSFLRILPRRQPLAIRYGVSAALVLAFHALLNAMGGDGRSLGFYLLFPAIFLAAVLFDHGSGVVATLLATALLYVRLNHDGGAIPPRVATFHLLAFALIGSGLAFVSEGLRTAWVKADASEREKDLLLRELGHRAVNNLAMVVSVLSLQIRSESDPGVREAFYRALTRVQAIADAHNHFRSVAREGEIAMRPYLEALAHHIGDVFRGLRPVAVRTSVDDVWLATQTAIPLGLIVNELVTNGFKHAFPDDQGGVVAVRLSGGAALTLVVEDNGVGRLSESKEGMGSRLIRLLTEHLGGKLSTKDANPGRRVRIDLPAAAPTP